MPAHNRVKHIGKLQRLLETCCGGLYCADREDDNEPGESEIRADCAQQLLTCDVGSGRQATQDAKFRRVNNLFSNFKTALLETYHAFNFAKYAYRFNHRFDLRTIVSSLNRDCVRMLQPSVEPGHLEILLLPAPRLLSKSLS